jgi:hypothetical protein
VFKKYEILSLMFNWNEEWYRVQIEHFFSRLSFIGSIIGDRKDCNFDFRSTSRLGPYACALSHIFASVAQLTKTTFLSQMALFDQFPWSVVSKIPIA